MGQTQPGAPAADPGQNPQPQGEDDDPWGDPNDQGPEPEPGPEPGPETQKGTEKQNPHLEYDPETKKYFDPYTGNYVTTPGKYEPPPAAPRPLRVKVRKRDHVRLRKKRRPPRPIPIPPSPKPTPPPQLVPRPPTRYDADGYPIWPEYDEYGNPLQQEYDEYGNPIEYDEYGYPIEYDDYGYPLEPDYEYDEYGDILPYYPYQQLPPDPPNKEEKPKFEYPDDGYDYDNDTYTFTTVESTPPPSTITESSDEVQEKDDSGDEHSMEDVEGFHWRPHQPILPKEEARALLRTGGEGCRCFPHRSDTMIPSMMYDKVQCPHTNNLVGHAHASVYRFEDNWDVKYTRVKRPKRHERSRSKVTQIWGYPDGQFPRVSGDKNVLPYEGGLRGEFRRPVTKDSDDDGEEGDDEKDDDNDGEAEKSISQGSKKAATATVQASQRGKDTGTSGDTGRKGEKVGNDATSQTGKSKAESKAGDDKKSETENTKNNAGKENNAAPRLSREKETKSLKKDTERSKKKGEDTDRLAQGSRVSIVVKSFLPRIGFTPDDPFSRGGTSRDDRGGASTQRHQKPSETPTLPPIPASPAFSMSSMLTTSQDFYVRPDIKTKRNFQGQYFDHATNKMYSYDIKPNYGRRVDQWTAQRR